MAAPLDKDVAAKQSVMINEQLFPAVKQYHVVRRIYLFVTLVAFTILMGGLMSAKYIMGRNFLVQSDLKSVQKHEINVASYSDTIITDLFFRGISFPLASAAELSLSDDDDSSDDEGNPDGKANQLHCLVNNTDGSCHTWSNVQHFYNQNGDLEIKYVSCITEYDEDNKDMMRVTEEYSHYQKVGFEENLVVEDKCLWLDTTLQQCSSYRPHYHEPFVHLSAAYCSFGLNLKVGKLCTF